MRKALFLLFLIGSFILLPSKTVCAQKVTNKFKEPIIKINELKGLYFFSSQTIQNPVMEHYKENWISISKKRLTKIKQAGGSYLKETRKKHFSAVIIEINYYKDNDISKMVFNKNTAEWGKDKRAGSKLGDETARLVLQSKPARGNNLYILLIRKESKIIKITFSNNDLKKIITDKHVNKIARLVLSRI